MKKRGSKNSGKRDPFTVVLEDIRDHFRVFGEVQSEMAKKQDSHTEMIAKLAVDLAEVKSDTEELKLDVTELKRDVTQLKLDVTDIKHDMRQKIDRSEFAKLEKRVVMLERRRH